jgi:hypothetical protein
MYMRFAKRAGPRYWDCGAKYIIAGLVPGIHALTAASKKDVDGRA